MPIVRACHSVARFETSSRSIAKAVTRVDEYKFPAMSNDLTRAYLGTFGRILPGESGAALRGDRLIGLILLLNNVAQALVATLTVLICSRLIHDGETALAIATLATAVLIFIFGESMPKTLGALYPERIALPAAYVYWPTLRLFAWVVDGANVVGTLLLRLFGVHPEEAAQHSLSTEELRTVVAEAGAMIPHRHQKMLLSILDLEKATVEDIMVPRNEITGIDISESWERVRETILERLLSPRLVVDLLLGGAAEDIGQWDFPGSGLRRARLAPRPGHKPGPGR